MSAALPAQTPFHQGVNLTGWLQALELGSIAPAWYSEQDFRNIRSLGCDVIRLPINLGRIAASSPDGKIPQGLFDILDEAVAWAGRNDLFLILDNHTQFEDQHLDGNLDKTLPGLWKQMALHFKDASPNILFEIFNEPHDLRAADWDRMQRAALAAIRAIDKTRMVIVSGAEWGSIDGLIAMKPYPDKNLLYSFHFYDPFVFTHQGAEWTDQVNLSGVPFPPDPKRQPALGDAPDRARLERDLRDFMEGSPLLAMAAQLDKAKAWSMKYAVPLFCGEIGVYQAKADPADRVAWYRVTRGLLEERGIPFATWDYQEGFGLFVKGSEELFDHDLDIPLLEALGLKVPPQTPYLREPENKSFTIYDDSVATGVRIGNWPNGGRIDFLATDRLQAGKYFLKFGGCDRYGSVGFVFSPTKDLSLLAAGKGSLGLWMRWLGPPAKLSLDLRFVQATDGTPGSLPWRRYFTVDAKTVAADGAWHRLDIPLSRFVEGGAWAEGWYDPAGRFDWKRVGRFEVIAEQGDLRGVEVGLDGLEIRFP